MNRINLDIEGKYNFDMKNDYFIFTFEYTKEIVYTYQDQRQEKEILPPTRYYQCFFRHKQNDNYIKYLNQFNKTYLINSTEKRQEEEINIETKHIYSSVEILKQGKFVNEYETYNRTQKKKEFITDGNLMEFRKNGEIMTSTYLPKKIQTEKNIQCKNVYKCCKYDDVFELKKSIIEQEKKIMIGTFKSNLDGTILTMEYKNKCHLDEIELKYNCTLIGKEKKYKNISETDFDYLDYIFITYPITTKNNNNVFDGDYFITNKISDLTMYMENDKEYKLLPLRFFVDKTYNIIQDTEDFKETILHT